MSTIIGKKKEKKTGQGGIKDYTRVSRVQRYQDHWSIGPRWIKRLFELSFLEGMNLKNRRCYVERKMLGAEIVEGFSHWE